MKYRGIAEAVAAMTVIGLFVYGEKGIEWTTTGASTSTSTPAVWNPCTGIPDDALRAAGLLPATEDSGIPSRFGSGREVCRWFAPHISYAVTVYSTTETVTELERWDAEDATIAGRTGRRLKDAGASEHLNCLVAFPAQQGAVQLRVHVYRDSLDDDIPCRVLDLVAPPLMPVLPR
ncbi:DUF3558 family protein [Nocardia sp. NPDC048505]|uniref:DUF3558 family protein n=1 Tax=unclassified Nocardia TaxID=2637762 RepID=UPI003400BC74